MKKVLSIVIGIIASCLLLCTCSVAGYFIAGPMLDGVSSYTINMQSPMVVQFKTELGDRRIFFYLKDAGANEEGNIEFTTNFNPRPPEVKVEDARMSFVQNGVEYPVVEFTWYNNGRMALLIPDTATIRDSIIEKNGVIVVDDGAVYAEQVWRITHYQETTRLEITNLGGLSIATFNEGELVVYDNFAKTKVEYEISFGEENGWGQIFLTAIRVIKPTATPFFEVPGFSEQG